MTNRSKLISLLFQWVAPIAVLLCGAWIVFAMGARIEPERKKAPIRKSLPVQVITPTAHLGTLDISTSGVVIPFREVKLSAKVGGEVVFKSDALSPGHTVDAGDVLLRIDDSDYKLEVARQEQEVARADVELERLTVDKQNAERLLKVNREMVALRERELDRMTQLRRQNATSIAESDIAELALLTTSQQATAQENQIRSFESQDQSLRLAKDLAMLQLERARIDLARTEIVAPFSGVVIANHVEQNATVTSGSLLATIEDTSSVEVRCSLRSDDIPFLKSSDSTSQNAYELPPVPVTIEYERSGRTYAWSGVLSRQDGLGLDQATRTMPVRVLVDKPAQNIFHESLADEIVPGDLPEMVALVRGMFVQVRFHCEPQQTLAVIPESVLRPGKQVWLMRDDMLIMQNIRIARIEQGQAFVDMTNSRLTLNDQIISSPVPNARDGLAISLMETQPKRGERKSSGETVQNLTSLDAPPSTTASLNGTRPGKPKSDGGQPSRPSQRPTP